MFSRDDTDADGQQRRRRYQGKHSVDVVSNDAQFEPVKPQGSEATGGWSEVSVPMMDQDAPAATSEPAPTPESADKTPVSEPVSDSAATGPISIEETREDDATADGESDASMDEESPEESVAASIPDPEVTDPDPDDVLSSYDLEPGPFAPPGTLAAEDPYAATYAPPTPDAPDLPEDTPVYFQEAPQYTLDIAEDVETDRRKNILIAVAIVAAVVCAALGVILGLVLGS
ncbi:MAG: hypothetical protein LUD25_03830 [Coriobacteriaceae bacterium]|nr:hypothetical protein [Coriobacteriaceae bacterium]